MGALPSDVSRSSVMFHTSLPCIVLLCFSEFSQHFRSCYIWVFIEIHWCTYFIFSLSCLRSVIRSWWLCLRCKWIVFVDLKEILQNLSPSIWYVIKIYFSTTHCNTVDEKYIHLYWIPCHILLLFYIPCLLCLLSLYNWNSFLIFSFHSLFFSHYKAWHFGRPIQAQLPLHSSVHLSRCYSMRKNSNKHSHAAGWLRGCDLTKTHNLIWISGHI